MEPDNGAPARATYRAAFRAWFGLPPAEADILATLYEARGSLVVEGSLATAAAIKVRTVRQVICDLRRALETEAVDSERGRGYRLTDSGMAECRAALWQMGEELRRAS